MALLREHFPGHLISKRGDVKWPPRFPDLSAYGYFLWGHLKAKVYIDKERTLEALSDAIIREIRAIPHVMLRRTTDNFSARRQQYLDKNGRHLHDVIFRK
jgi:hypothetical protein